MGLTTDLAIADCGTRNAEWSEAELAALAAEPQHLAMLLAMIREDLHARALGLIAGYAAEPAQEQAA